MVRPRWVELSTYQEVRRPFYNHDLDSNMEISASYFKGNKALSNGGAIYALSFTNLIISNDTKFIDNEAVSLGSDLFAQDSS